MTERHTVFVGNLDHRCQLAEIRGEFERSGFKLVGFGMCIFILPTCVAALFRGNRCTLAAS